MLSPRPLATLTATLVFLCAMGCTKPTPSKPSAQIPGGEPTIASLTARVTELKSELSRVSQEKVGRDGNTPWTIINFHDHLYKVKHARKYIKAAQKVGIAKTVLVASPHFTTRGNGSKTEGFDENFATIMKVVKRWPDHFIPFSSVDPGSPDALAMVKRHRAAGAQGLKLYNGHSIFYVKEQGLLPDTLIPILEFCDQENMPIIWHVRFSRFLKEFEEKVLKVYPSLKIVVAHYGVAFWRPKGRNMDEIPRLLAAYPNLYFDTSLGTRGILVDGLAVMGKHRKKFVELFKRFPDRFVMGTDMVITGNREKTSSWIEKVMWAVRDQLEKDRFTFDLAARWSKYAPKSGADSNGAMKGLALPPEILKQIYETTPKKLLSL